jgi:hypothetical protein
MSLIDLHVHTSASDGRYTPAELVALAAEKGLEALAVTDHDTLDGLPEALEAAGDYPGLKLLPGIEISSHSPGSEVHILGYFVRLQDAELLTHLALMRNSRTERAGAMVEKLRGLGFDICLERVREIAGEGNLGRPHIAQALLEKGYVSSLQEVFTLYLGQGCAAYVDRHKLTPAEAVSLITRAGGLAVLAHPTTVGNLYDLVPQLKAAGLAGIEVYYKDYAEERRQELAKYARRHRLIATGGSDFHGIDEATEVMLGGAGAPIQAYEDLMRLANERGCI